MYFGNSLIKRRSILFVGSSVVIGVILSAATLLSFQTDAAAASNCGIGATYDPATLTLSLNCTESTDVHQLSCLHSSKPEHLSLTVNGVNKKLDCPMNLVPSVSLTANGIDDNLTIVEGEDLKLEWNSKYVSSCSAPWTIATAISGVETKTNVTLGTVSYAIACIDTSGSTVSDSVTVVGVRPANLTISGNLSASAGYSLIDGTYNTVTLGYAIENKGDTYAPASVLRFAIDLESDGIVDENVIKNITGINPGATYGSYQITVGNNVPVGDVTVTVYADVDNEVYEGGSGETDNEKTISLQLSYKDPQISLVTNPDKLVRNGQSISLLWDTKASYFDSCTIKGPTLTGYNFIPAVDGIVGTLNNVGPITSKFEFILECTAPDGTVFSDSVLVSSIGTMQEI